MGFPRAGSNPAGCGLFLGHKKRENGMSGVGFEPTQSFDYESLNLTP